jgi:hypothetical protein
MKHPQENPPRLPGETVAYEDDPFELGELDDTKFSSSRFVVVAPAIP